MKFNLYLGVASIEFLMTISPLLYLWSECLVSKDSFKRIPGSCSMLAVNCTIIQY